MRKDPESSAVCLFLLVLFDSGSALMNSQNLMTTKGILTQNNSTLGKKASTYEFGEPDWVHNTYVVKGKEKNASEIRDA